MAGESGDGKYWRRRDAFRRKRITSLPEAGSPHTRSKAELRLSEPGSLGHIRHSDTDIESSETEGMTEDVLRARSTCCQHSVGSSPNNSHIPDIRSSTCNETLNKQGSDQSGTFETYGDSVDVESQSCLLRSDNCCCCDQTTTNQMNRENNVSFTGENTPRRCSCHNAGNFSKSASFVLVEGNTASLSLRCRNGRCFVQKIQSRNICEGVVSRPTEIHCELFLSNDTETDDCESEGFISVKGQRYMGSDSESNRSSITFTSVPSSRSSFLSVRADKRNSYSVLHCAISKKLCCPNCGLQFPFKENAMPLVLNSDEPLHGQGDRSVKSLPREFVLKSNTKITNDANYQRVDISKISEEDNERHSDDEIVLDIHPDSKAICAKLSDENDSYSGVLNALHCHDNVTDNHNRSELNTDCMRTDESADVDEEIMGTEFSENTDCENEDHLFDIYDNVQSCWLCSKLGIDFFCRFSNKYFCVSCLDTHKERVPLSHIVASQNDID
ncbi:uncharacterized protein LOC128204275 [Mya arenaria]|uniref:uncharacterized protein LOC128204275 n=1 Tax=Mya arenaria TaxID=6604 RepID=UPI0022E3B259|nr:uncharacterized protein LOC128204275 [Mya arenaria]